MFSAIRRRLTLRSVRARLTFWYLLTLGTSLSAFAVFVFLARAHTLYRELDAELEVRTHELLTELRPALLGLDIAAGLGTIPHAMESPLIVRQVPDTTIFRSPALPRLDWRAERQLATAAREHTPLVTIEGQPPAPLRVATIVLQRPGAQALVLQVAASTESVQDVLGQLAGTMILVIMLVLGVASYGSGVTARRALAPVDEIVSRVRDIQTSRLGERLDIHAGSDELDRLVATLNEMLDRIESSVRSARRFAADASHELQTPIAAMRSVVDVWLREGYDARDHRPMAIDLLEELERMSTLVRDLRLFTSADAGYVLEGAGPVDVAKLASECCEIARAVAEEKQIEVEEDIQDRPVVGGSALHLRRVILNLLENAVRYSPPASRIGLAVGSRDGHAVVTVRDRGCGIHPADLPHIFEPFYRADPARARETGGTGLGLAIVDQIVRAHGGRVRVESVPGEGSTFAVHLPTAPPGGSGGAAKGVSA